MCDMFICFSDAPVEDDPRLGNHNRWKISMKDAPLRDPLHFLYGCCCGPCAQGQLRYKALGGTLAEYKCCQGYFNMGCMNAGSCGESSAPECCLCLEVCCCHSCALSANRFLIMDQRNLISDPCDNRIIRFNNFLQCLSCILDILAIFIEELRDAADIVRCIANLVYWITAGCMTAQMFYELDETKGPPGAPPVQEMTRTGQEKSGMDLAGSQPPVQVPVQQAMPVQATPVQATPVQATPVQAVPVQGQGQAPYPVNMTKS